MSRQDAPKTTRAGSFAAIGMVARREVKARFLTKSNIISLAVMLTIIVVGVFVLDYFVNRDEDTAATGTADYTLAVDASVSDLEPQLTQAGAAMDTSLEIIELTRTDAEPRLSDDVDAFLSGEPGRPQLLVEEQPGQQLLALVTSAAESHVLTTEVTALGGDPQQVGEALAMAVPQVESLVAEEEAAAFGPEYLVAILSISLLFFALINSGSVIAMGVVEEKTSRVVEILLATIRPSQLLAGKILGIGIVGLSQVVILGGAAGAAFAATGLLEGFEIDLGATMLLVLLWFLLGFAVFSLLFGGFAALISRQEEIGAVTTPLLFLMFIPFYMSMFMGMSNGTDSTLMRVLSQIPFFAPFMMPVRHVYGGVEAWEMALAIGIAIVTIPLLVWIAARVYRRGVLHTGGRMKLRQALRG